MDRRRFFQFACVISVYSVLEICRGGSPCIVTIQQNGQVAQDPAFPYQLDAYDSPEMVYLRSIAATKNIFVKPETGSFNELTSVVEGGVPIDMSLPWKEREWDMMKAIVWYVSHLMTFCGSDTCAGLLPDEYHPDVITPDDPDYVKWTDLFEGKKTIPAAIRTRAGQRRFGWSCGTMASAAASIAMAHGIPARLVNGMRIEYDNDLGHDVILGGDYCCSFFSTRFNRWVFFFQHSYAWFEDGTMGEMAQPLGLRELVTNSRELAESIELFTDGRPGVGDYPNGNYVVPHDEWVGLDACGIDSTGYRRWTWVAAAASNGRLRFMPEELIAIPGTNDFGYALMPPTQDCADTRTYGASATVGWWKSHFRYMLISYKTQPNTGRNSINEFYNGCDYVMTEENADAGFTAQDLQGDFPICAADSPGLTYPLNNVQASATLLSDHEILVSLTHNMFDFLTFEMKLDDGDWQPLQLAPHENTYVWNAGPCGSTLAIRGVNLAGVHSPDVNMSVECPAIAIEPRSLPAATVGVSYSQALVASGGEPPYVWSLASGELPAGMSLLPSGTISGMTNVVTESTFVIQVDDSSGCAGSLALTLRSCQPLTITPATAQGWVGIPYTSVFVAAGGAGAYRWEVIDGELPEGLLLASSGLVAGAPLSMGSSVFTIRAIDSLGCFSDRVCLIVIGACPPIDISPVVVRDGIVGHPYMITFAASGGTPPYGWAEIFGEVPDGLFLHPTTGVLDGIPTAAGTSEFGLLTIDGSGCAATRDFALTVHEACQLIGDLTHDGRTNGADIRPFVDCLTGGLPSGPNCGCGDLNADGNVNQSDIAPFVSTLLQH